MDPVDVEIAPERLPRPLARGRILQGKSFGLDRRGIHVERFAHHHIRPGGPIVARDLLDDRIEALQRNDPDGRPAMTEALAEQILPLLEGVLS